MINFLCRKFGAKKFSLEDIYLSDTHRRKEKKLCQMPGSTAVPHRKLKPVSFFSEGTASHSRNRLDIEAAYSDVIQ